MLERLKIKKNALCKNLGKDVVYYEICKVRNKQQIFKVYAIEKLFFKRIFAARKQ